MTISIMIILLITFRIHELIGELNYIPKINETKEIEIFLKKNTNSLIFFDDSEDPCPFAKFSLNKLKKNINFALSTNEIGKSYGCLTFPCIKAFLNGKLIDTYENLPLSSIDFMLWSKNLFEGNFRTLYHPEEIRLLLEGKKTIIFGVDVKEIPKYIPNDIIFYSTSSELFKLLNFNVSKGIYQYNPSERYLRLLSNKNKYDENEYIMNYPNDNIQNKKYWGGFVIDTDNNKDNEKEFQLLTDLGKKYSKDINFINIYGEAGLKILKFAHIQYFDIPFFVLFESNKTLQRRWSIINYNDLHNFTYLDNFINDIIYNNKPPIRQSENIIENKNRKMLTTSHNNLNESLLSSEYDSVVLFTSKQCQICLRLFLLVNKTASLLRQNPIKIYHFNTSLNDIPEYINFLDSLPSLYYFKRKDLDNPIKFRGIEEVDSIIDFIKSNSKIPIDVPYFDSKKVHDDIANEFLSIEKYKENEIIITKKES